MKISFFPLILLVPLLLVASPSRPNKTEEMRKRIDQLEQNLAALRQEFTELQGEMAALRQVIRLSPSGVQIRSDHALQIQSVGPLDLKGTVIRFNGGNRPAAAVGSKISAPPLSGTGVIVEGSPTVLLK